MNEFLSEMKNPKRTYYRSLFIGLFALGLFYSQPVQATHIIGGELAYEYLGNNEYRVILTLYRNCQESTPSNPVANIDPFSYIDIFDENGNQWPGISPSTKTLDLIDSSVDTIPNNIAGDPCLFVPTSVCVESARYEGVIKVEGSGGFYVVYQRCCRNADILNIINPTFAGATYWLYVSPIARALANTTPRFGAYPPVFVCVNVPLNHPSNASDINGDSLAYKLYTPFLGATEDAPQPAPAPQPPYPGEIQPPPFDQVFWNTPIYNQDQMLGPGSSPLAIDVHTGQITAFPNVQGRFVVGVLVEEYRNGVLLSVVRRDFQYEVGECAKLDVQIVAPDAQCDDLTVHFENETAVAQNFVWYFDWPNPSPSSNLREVTYTYPDTGTYTVALVAEPVGACVDTGFHEIFLQLNSLTADFDWQTYDCSNQSVLVLQDLSVDTVSPIVSWNWEVNYLGTALFSSVQNPVFQIPNTAVGTIKLTVVSENGCEQVKIVNFQAGGNNPLDQLDTVSVCLGSIAQLNPNGPTTGFTYQWGPPVPLGQQNLPNPSVSPTVNTTYPVTITGYNNLCQSTGSVTVVVFQPVQLAFEPDTDCDATIVHFINQSQNAPTGVVWNFGDTTTVNDVSNQFEPTYDYPAFGSYTVTLMTPPNAVCKDTIQESILLTQKTLEAAFSFGYSSCEEGVVTVHFMDETINSEDDTNNWLWTFTGVVNDTSTLMNPTVQVQQDGWLYVTLKAMTNENCSDTTALDSLYIDLTELPNIENGGEVLGCLSNGVTLNPGGDTSYVYAWSPSAGLSCTNCPSPHANPLQSTTYTVSVMNLNGADTCGIIRQIAVRVPPNIQLIGSNDVETCDNTTMLSASVAILPVDYAWFNQNGQQIAGDVSSVSVPVSGYSHYVVRATDLEGCHYYDTIQVVGGSPNIEAVGDQIICSDGALNISATNLDPNDTLTWQWLPYPIFNGPTNVPNPSVSILAGDRTLYVTATNQFGCSATDSVYVAVVDINNSLDFTYSVSCNGSTVNFTNTSTNAFNFSWDFGDNTTVNDTSFEDNPTYTYPGSGIYIVKLTMDFDLACVDTLEKPVEILTTQYVPDFTFEYVSCETDSIQVQFHDATTIYQVGTTVDSYIWVTSNGDTSYLADPIFTVYDGQEFIVTMYISTSNGCDGSKTEELKLEFIEEYLPDTLVLCYGDSLGINPLGSTEYAYHWTPNIAISDQDAANPTIWPTQTTTYTVEITNLVPDTCSIIRTVTVFVPEKIEVVAPADTLTCGQQVSLCATANLPQLDYNWAIIPDGFIGAGSCLTVLPSEDTYYEVVATDQYGCDDRDTVFVADESVKMVWQNLGAECPEIERQLTVNNLVPDHVLDYVWSATGSGLVLPPAMGPSATIVTPVAGQVSNFSVVATNQYGCTGTVSQFVTSHNFVPTVVESDTVCPNVTQPLNPGANPNLNYVWTPSQPLSCSTCPNPDVTIAQPTSFTVVVSAMYGSDVCKDTIGVNLFVPPVIEINETVDTFTCGEPIQVAAQITPTNTTNQWFDSSGGLVGLNVNTLTVDPVDMETYIILVKDAFQCSTSDTIVVENRQLDLELTGGGVIDTCPMPSYNICIINLDPEDLLDYDWTASNGGTILDGDGTPCPEVTSEQGETSLFEVVVTNQWGCSSTEQFDITTYAFNPMVRATIDICPEVPTPINPEAEGSTLDYYWTPSTGLSCTNCPNPEATLSASQAYQVMIFGYNGADTCSYTQTVQVRVAPKINLEALPTDTVLCDSTDLLLTATYTSPFVTDFAWSKTLDFNNPFATTPTTTVTPNGTELYYVQLTDTLGCHDTALVTVYAYPVDISVGEIHNYCEEIGSLLIPVINHHPDQTLTFTWSPTDYIEVQNPDGSIQLEGLMMDETYTVTAVNQYGCEETETTEVYYYNIELTLDSITSTEDTIIFGSGQFSQLGINDWPGYTYEWSPSAGLNDPTIPNPTATPEETTTYVLTVTDEGGCTATRTVTIYVWNPDCDEPNLFLPNAFTPNDDDGNDMNDVLYFRSNIVVEMELAIYNRWGQRVFFTEDQSIGWDGKFNGQALSPDVYGFYLRAKCYNGQEYFKKGNITLIR